MQRTYKLNVFFNDNGITLNDLLYRFFDSLVNEDFSILDKNNIMKLDTCSLESK